jgi:choline dehydrogenase
MYDYIVVGAGSAGCVLASRLAEDPRVTVLLLEAGPSGEPLRSRVPSAYTRLHGSARDWSYRTSPQPGLDGRRVTWSAGRTLGGTGAMNAMIYLRGHPSDYDRWRDAGGTGWGYRDVLPYFLRAQHQERGASLRHAVGGPISVADPRDVHPLSCAFVGAAFEAGLSYTSDFNADAQDGAWFFQVTQRDGVRSNAATAYLRPARRRRNLRVMSGAHVTRVLFDRARATGVQVRIGRTMQDVVARREVIVSAGAIGSPHLLLRSGIGPAEHLREHRIPVVADLPGVGGNLQDHLAVPMAWTTKERSLRANAHSLGNVVRYSGRRQGPLSSNVLEAGAFVRSRAELAAPDLMLLFAPAFALGLSSDEPGGDGFTIAPVLLRPGARGRVTLCSTRAEDPPHIDPHYLITRRDVDTLLAGVAVARQIADAEPLATLRDSGVLLGHDARTREEITDCIRRDARSVGDAVGTCKMGRDSMAVVDPSLRVYGVKALRVIDASVFPSAMGGTAEAPTIMLAERAIDILRADTTFDAVPLPQDDRNSPSVLPMNKGWATAHYLDKGA